MFEKSQCPECDSHDTERVELDVRRDEVQEIRICNDCPTQYVVSFGDPMVIDTTVFDHEDTEVSP